MVSLEDRLKNVHPNARKKVRDGAKYVSGGLSEYYITRDDVGYWYIVKYNGGALPTKLRTKYTTFMECEQNLISYLSATDKFGRAIYPRHG